MWIICSSWEKNGHKNVSFETFNKNIRFPQASQAVFWGALNMSESENVRIHFLSNPENVRIGKRQNLNLSESENVRILQNGKTSESENVRILQNRKTSESENVKIFQNRKMSESENVRVF